MNDEWLYNMLYRCVVFSALWNPRDHRTQGHRSSKVNEGGGGAPLELHMSKHEIMVERHHDHGRGSEAQSFKFSKRQRM
jgi:hypothetical protein